MKSHTLFSSGDDTLNIRSLRFMSDILQVFQLLDLHVDLTNTILNLALNRTYYRIC